MKISVLHPSLNSGGGSERVCLDIIEALKRAEYSVSLCTFEKTDWTTVERYYGKFTKPDREIVGRKFLWDFTYGEMANYSFLVLKIYKSSDIIIVSTTSPNVFGMLNAYPYSSKKFIFYVNMLPFIYQGNIWRFYYTPYIAIQRKTLSKVRDLYVLVNSSFGSKIIGKTFGISPRVVYPPVGTENFYSSKKQNLIASVGRFSPFKRFEVLINSIVNIDEGKCVIIGSAARNAFRESITYVGKIRKMINELKLQDRITLLINCPFDVLRDTLSKAKLFVNCTLFEPFGIGVVEGMASGCVPVVHRSGGAYADIIDHDKYGFSFGDTNELADKISLLLKDDDLCRKYSRQAVKRSEFFSRENFKKRIQDIMKSVCNCSI